MLNCFTLVGFLISVHAVSGSTGDRSVVYQQCAQNCKITYSCPDKFHELGWGHTACFRCRHECVWGTVGYFQRNVNHVPQFHGKWPFAALDVAIFGINFILQEPASVVFSLLNFYTVYLMYTKICLLGFFPNKHVWIGYAKVGMITWLCSALFHARDVWLTEYLDYFSAFAYVLYALYASIVLVFPRLSLTSGGKNISRVIAVSLCLFYTFHVKSMMEKFDYGYNMTCCIAVSVMSTVLYIFYLFSRFARTASLTASDKKLMLMLVWMNGSVALELLDFTPLWWTFDAHSLFHLATVPIPLWFSSFLLLKIDEDVVDRFTKNV